MNDACRLPAFGRLKRAYSLSLTSPHKRCQGWALSGRTMDEYTDVIKKYKCPACGIEEVMRFHHRQMMMEAPCSSCGAMVRWDPDDRASSESLFGDVNEGQAALVR